jgi:hypothetical protein
MAKRRDTEREPLFDDETDDVFESDDAAEPSRGANRRDEQRRRRRGPRPGGGVVGAPETALLPPPDRVNIFSVIVGAVAWLALFLLIGFIVALIVRLASPDPSAAEADADGGTETAQVAGASAGSSETMPAAGTPVAALADAPAGDAGPLLIPTDGPTPTPDPGCTLGLGWWLEIQDEWAFFAGAARTEWLTPLDAAQYDATLEALRVRRGEIGRVFTPPCYLAARADLLSGADGMIGALELLKAGDSAGGRAAADSAAAQLARVLIQLWEQGTFTSPDSPPTAGVPRGGGETCQPADWYAQAAVNLTALRDALDAYVASAGVVLTQQLQIGNLDAAIGNFSVLNPTGCAAIMQTIAVNAYSAAVDGLRLFTSGQTGEGRARIGDFWAQKTVLDAWLTWLGLRVI